MPAARRKQSDGSQGGGSKCPTLECDQKGSPRHHGLCPNCYYRARRGGISHIAARVTQSAAHAIMAVQMRKAAANLIRLAEWHEEIASDTRED